MPKVATLTLALLLAAQPGLALAAANPAAPGMPMSEVAGGKNITCRAFLDLSGDAATKVLYFLNGYAAGIADQLAADTVPPQNATAAKGSAPSINTEGFVSSTPALNGVDRDQLRTLCRTKPTATALSVIPGGLPISSSGAEGLGTAAGTGSATGLAGTSTGTSATP